MALRRFREDVLLPGRWDPAKGASLKTFFIGQCLMRFPNIYRQWLADLHRNNAVPAETADLDALALGRHDSPENDVITALSAAQELADVKDRRVREALVMIGAGYRQKEIATRLGVSEKAVERMLANERSRAKRRGAG